MFQFLKQACEVAIVCLVAKPLNRSEAKVDLVMIQTLLLFKCKLLCDHVNEILVFIKKRSPLAQLQIKDLATKHTTVKWPILRLTRMERINAEGFVLNLFIRV